MDARRARGARRLGEPAAPQRELVAVRLSALGRAANCAVSRQAVPPSLAPELGALAAEDAPVALEPGHDPRVHHPDVGEQRLRAAHAPRTPAASTPRPRSRRRPVEAEAAVGVVLVPAIVGPAKPGGGPSGCHTRIAEADDLRVGLGAVVQQLGRVRPDRSASRARCSCSARRCTARTPSTCGSRRRPRPSPWGTSR